MTLTRVLALLLALTCCVACASRQPKIRTAEHIDLTRYMGCWHVVACVDNSVERRFVYPVECYSLRRDGRSIDVVFHWHDQTSDSPLKEHKFTGQVKDPGINARWRMKLFPLFGASYQIVEVGPRYEWAAVAHPSRKFGWILSRTPILPETQYQHALQALGEQTYDVHAFIRLPQDTRH